MSNLLSNFSTRFRWSITTKDVSKNVWHSDTTLDKDEAALQDIRLFNEFCTRHNVDIISYKKDVKEEAALLCIMNADDTRLFNEFCAAHNINILSYVDSKGGNDMLFMAAKVNATKIIRLLIENYNFDVNSKNRCNETALHIASRNGNIDVVQILIEKGADVSAEFVLKLKYGYNSGSVKPIHEAVKHGHVDIVDFLINNEADAFEKDSEGYSLLHFGVYNGHVNVIQYLLNLGLDIEGRSHIGETPLHVAAAHGHVNVVCLLIENGVDVDAKDNYGRTCIDKASRYGFHKIVEVLKSSGKRIK